MAAVSGKVSRDASGGPPLLVDDVRIRYGSRTVVDGVSLSLAAGEIYGLLGPNGAGKSTLIRAMCGRMRLAGGNILIHGKRIRPGAGPSPHLGRVAQKVALLEHLTVRENLSTFGHLFGLGGRRLRLRTRDVLERLDIASLARVGVARLSGGQRQRLHIAVALLTEPDILILDEPTVGVDLASRQKLYEVLKDLAKGGMAILITTHDLPEARILSDRVGILVAGQLVAEGTPDALIDDRFGGMRKARICARTGADQARLAFLSRLGLSRVGLTEWSGLLDEARDLPQLFQNFQRCPDLITELVLSRPDLEDLFAHWQDGGPPMPELSEEEMGGPQAARETQTSTGHVLIAADPIYDFAPEDVCPERAMQRMVQ